MEIIAARGWPETECNIISSDVKSHSSSDGTTYSIEVRYSYRVYGRSYEGERYSFFTGSSSGRDGKQAVVDTLEPGSYVPCFYDPEHPESAVIHRGFQWVMLVGLVPLVFVLVGGGGIYGVLLGARRKRPKSSVKTQRGAPAVSFTREAYVESADSLTLRPAVSPRGKVIGALFVTCFWNGIVGVFLYQVIGEAQRGSFPWGLSLFLTPFVLVGIFLIYLTIYYLLATFNPRPQVTLSRAKIPLGEQIRVDWKFSGTAKRIRKLRLTVEGREEATYRRGTDTHTDKSTFYEQELKSTENSFEIGTGSVSFHLPENSVPTFASDNNRIVWSLRLRGTIDRWPDVDETFDLSVVSTTSRR